MVQTIGNQLKILTVSLEDKLQCKLPDEHVQDADGADGAGGADGADGADCADGADGVGGADGADGAGGSADGAQTLIPVAKQQ